jgi:hypothetical protein
MRRNQRWRQQFAAKFDQLGQRLGGGSVVGMHGAFVALPFTTPASQASTTGVRPYAPSDQLHVTSEHLEALPIDRNLPSASTIET